MTETKYVNYRILPRVKFNSEPSFKKTAVMRARVTTNPFQGLSIVKIYKKNIIYQNIYLLNLLKYMLKRE